MNVCSMLSVRYYMPGLVTFDSLIPACPKYHLMTVRVLIVRNWCSANFVVPLRCHFLIGELDQFFLLAPQN